MKRKVMRNWFIALFVIGLAMGYVLPGDLQSLSAGPVKANVIEVSKSLGQLNLQDDYSKYSVLAKTETASVQLVRIDDKTPLHRHKGENKYVYVFKGTASVVLGSKTQEVGPGNLIIVPSGTLHSVTRVGDSPVELMVFSSPPAGYGETTVSQK